MEKLTDLEFDRLPDFLKRSLIQWEQTMKKMDSGELYLQWDLDFCELQADVGTAEANHIIDSELAWKIRTEYLGMERV